MVPRVDTTLYGGEILPPSTDCCLAEDHRANALREVPVDFVEVSPHPGTIIFRPWIINRFIYLNNRQLVDENGDPPDRYRRACCGNPTATRRLLIGWGSKSQRAERFAPLANIKIQAHPGRIDFQPRMMNSSVHL